MLNVKLLGRQAPKINTRVAEISAWHQLCLAVGGFGSALISILLSADGENNEVRVLKRDDGTVVGSFGRNGRNLTLTVPITFAEAALGVLALIVDPESVDARESREVRAQADTPETLLVAWVDECLYVHEIEGFAARRVEVTDCSDSVVHGRVLGEPLDPGRHRLGTVVKAATLHGVSVKVDGGRHEVRVIVDV